MRRFVLLAGASLLTVNGAAAAQTNARPDVPTDQALPAASDQPDDTRGDIVVTAQRRAQNLKDVPIAITVVSGAALRDTAANTISDIQTFTPSLSISSGGGLTSFKIRGVGARTFDYGVEQSVGLVVDDVVQGLPRAPVLNTLADLDRIETLRGPQGTLFGKNTSAGLISITTHKPELNVRSYDSHVQYGSRDELQTYQVVNLPIGDTLAIRLRAGYQRRDPVVTNRGRGAVPDSRDVTLNGKVYWKPTDRLSFNAIGDYQKSRGDNGIVTVRTLGIGTPAPLVGNRFIAVGLAAAGIVPGAGNRVVNNSADNFMTAETKGGQLTISYDAGPAVVTSVTAYRDMDYRNNLDSDQSPLALLDINTATISARQITQEIRVANSDPGPVEYVAGLFFYDQTLKATQDQRGTLGYIPTTAPFLLSVFGGLFNVTNDSRSYAAFGDVTWKPVDRVRLIVGGRYTVDRLNVTNNLLPIARTCALTILLGGGCTPVPLPTPAIGDRLKQGNWSGRTGAQFDITRGIMAYATASRGYKAPAVTVISGQAFNIRKETVFALEAGVKAELFDRRLSANVAVFRSKFKDFQTEVFDAGIGLGGAYRTGNAGALRAQGVEAELSARPFRGFVLSGGLTYNDATFGDYRPPCYVTQTAAQGCTLRGPTFDAAGMRLQNAPRWSCQVTGGYETAVTDRYKVFGTANWSHRSSILFGVGDPGTFQDGYGILNLSAGVGTIDDVVRVSVFARNALDKRFASVIFRTPLDVGGTSQVIADQAVRRIGASLDWRF